MPHVYTLEENYEDIADAIREKLGVQTTYKPGEMAAAISSIGGGGATDNNWAEIMRHESTTLFDNTITRIYNYGLRTNNADSYITSIELPQVTEIGRSAFEGQAKAKSISLPLLADLKSTYEFYLCAKLESITLPALSHTESAYNTLGYTFRGCSAIKKIDLGNNSTIFNQRFNQYCFNSCTNLKALILRWNNVVINSASNNLMSSGIASGIGYIYVPSSLVSSYQAASYWSTYASRIRAIEDYSDDGTVNGNIIV